MPAAYATAADRSVADPAWLEHLCAVIAGRGVLTRLGNPDLAALRLRCCTVTIERMVASDSERQWTYPRLRALAALERDVLGTAELSNALTGPRLPIAAVSVDAAGADLLRRASGLVAGLAVDLTTDDHLDDRELARVVGELPALRAALDHLQSIHDQRQRQRS